MLGSFSLRSHPVYILVICVILVSLISTGKCELKEVKPVNATEAPLLNATKVPPMTEKAAEFWEKTDRMGTLRVILCGAWDLVGDVVDNLKGVSKIFEMFRFNAVDVDAIVDVGTHYYKAIVSMIEKGPPNVDFLQLAGMHETTWENVGEKLLHVGGVFIDPKNFGEMEAILKAFSPYPQARYIMNKANQVAKFVWTVSESLQDFARGKMFAFIGLEDTVQLNNLMKVLEDYPDHFEVIVRTVTAPEKVIPMYLKLKDDPMAACLDPRILEPYVNLGENSNIQVRDIVSIICKTNWEELFAEMSGSKSRIMHSLLKIFSDSNLEHFDVDSMAHNIQGTVKSVYQVIEEMSKFEYRIHNQMWPEERWRKRLVNDKVWGEVFHRLGRYFESFGNKTFEDYIKIISPTVQLVLGEVSQDDGQLFVRLEQGLVFLKRLMVMVEEFPKETMFAGTSEMKKFASLLNHAPEIVEEFIYMATDFQQVAPLLMQLASGADMCSIPQVLNMSMGNFFCKQVDQSVLMDELVGKNGMFTPLALMFSSEFYDYFDAKAFGRSLEETVMMAEKMVEKMSITIMGFESGKIPMPRFMNGTVWGTVFGRVAMHFMGFSADPMHYLNTAMSYLPQLEQLLSTMTPEVQAMAAMMDDGVKFGIGVNRFMQDLINQLKFDGTVELKKIVQKMDTLPSMLEDLLYRLDSADKLTPVILQVFAGVDICTVPQLQNATLVHFFCKEVSYQTLLIEVAQHEMTGPLVKLMSFDYSTAPFNASRMTANIKTMVDEVLKTVGTMPTLIGNIMNGTAALPMWMNPAPWMASFGRISGHVTNMSIDIAETVKDFVPLVQIVLSDLGPEMANLTARLHHGIIFMNQMLDMAPTIASLSMFNHTVELKRVMKTLDNVPDWFEEIANMVMNPSTIESATREFVGDVPVCNMTVVRNTSLGRFICYDFNAEMALGELMQMQYLVAPLIQMFSPENPKVFDLQKFVKDLQSTVMLANKVAVVLPQQIMGYATGQMPIPGFANPSRWGAVFARFQAQELQMLFDGGMKFLKQSPMLLRPYAEKLTPEGAKLVDRMTEGLTFLTRLPHHLPDLTKAFNLTDRYELDKVVSWASSPQKYITALLEVFGEEPSKLLLMIISGKNPCDSELVIKSSLNEVCKVNVSRLVDDLVGQNQNLSRPLINMLVPKVGNATLNTSDVVSNFFDSFSAAIDMVSQQAMMEMQNQSASVSQHAPSWSKLVFDVVDKAGDAWEAASAMEWVKATIPLLKWPFVSNITREIVHAVHEVYQGALGIYYSTDMVVKEIGLCEKCPLGGMSLLRVRGHWMLGKEMWDDRWGTIYKRHGEWWIGGYLWHEFFRTHKRVGKDWIHGNFSAEDTLARCVKHVDIQLEGCLDYDEIRGWLDTPGRHDPPKLDNKTFTWSVYGISWTDYLGLLNYYNSLSVVKMAPDGKNFTMFPKLMKDGSVYIGNVTWPEFVDKNIHDLLSMEGMAKAAELNCANWYPWLKDKHYTDSGCIKFDEIAKTLTAGDLFSLEPENINGRWFIDGKPWEMYVDEFNYYFKLAKGNVPSNHSIVARAQYSNVTVSLNKTVRSKIVVGNQSWPSFVNDLFHKLLNLQKTPGGADVDCMKWKEGSWECKADGFMKSSVNGTLSGIYPEFRNGSWWLDEDMWPEHWGKWEKKFGKWYVNGMPWEEFFMSHKLVRDNWIPGFFLPEDTWYNCLAASSLDVFPLDDCIDFDYLNKFISTSFAKTLRFDGKKLMYMGNRLESHATIFKHVMDILSKRGGFEKIPALDLEFSENNGSVIMKSGNESWLDQYGRLAGNILKMALTPEGEEVSCTNKDFLKDLQWECKDGMFLKGHIKAKPEYKHGQFWILEDMWHWSPWQFRNGTWFVDGMPWNVFFKEHKLINDKWVRGIYPREETWLDCLDPKWISSLRPDKCLNLTQFVQLFNHSTESLTPHFKNGTWRFENVTWSEFVVFYKQIRSQVTNLPLVDDSFKPEPVNGSVAVKGMSWKEFYAKHLKPVIEFSSSMEAKLMRCENSNPNDGYDWECKDGKFWKGSEQAVPRFKYGSWWLNEDEWAWDPFFFNEQENTWFIGNQRWDKFFSTHKLVNGAWMPVKLLPLNESWIGCVKGALEMTKPQKEDCIDFADVLLKFDVAPPQFKEGKWRVQGMVWEEFAKKMQTILDLLSVPIDGLQKPPRVENETIIVGQHTWDDFANKLLNVIRDASKSKIETDCSKQDPNRNYDWICKNGQFWKGSEQGRPEYRNGEWWINDDQWKWEKFQYNEKEDTWFVGTEPWQKFFNTHKLVNGKWLYDEQLTKNQSWFDCLNAVIPSTKPKKEDCVDFAGFLRGFDLSPPQFKQGKWHVQGMVLEEFVVKVQKVLDTLSIPMPNLGKPLRVVNETIMIGDSSWETFATGILNTIRDVSSQFSGAELDCANEDPNKDMTWECKNGQFHKGTVTAQPEYRHFQWWLSDDPWAWDPWDYREDKKTWYVREMPFDKFFKTHKLIDNVWIRGLYPREDTWLPCLNVTKINMTKPKLCLNVSEYTALLPRLSKQPVFKSGQWWVTPDMPWSKFHSMVNVFASFAGLQVKFGLPRVVNQTVMIGDMSWGKMVDFVQAKINEFQSDLKSAVLDCGNQNPEEDQEWVCRNGQFWKGKTTAKPVFKYGTFWLGSDSWKWADWYLVNNEWHIKGKPVEEFFTTHKLVENEWVEGKYRRNETWADCILGPWLDVPQQTNCIEFDKIKAALLKAETVLQPQFANGSWHVLDMRWNEFKQMLQNLHRFINFDEDAYIFMYDLYVLNNTVSISDISWPSFMKQLVANVTKFEKSLDRDFAECSNKGDELVCKDGQWRKGNRVDVGRYEFGTTWVFNDMWLAKWGVIHMKEGEWYVGDVPFDEFFLNYMPYGTDGSWIRGSYPRNITYYDCMKGAWMTNSDTRRCIDVKVVAGLFDSSLPVPTPEYRNGTWYVMGTSLNRFMGILQFAQRLIPSLDIPAVFSDNFYVRNGNLMIGQLPWRDFYQTAVKMVTKLSPDNPDVYAVNCANFKSASEEHWTCENGQFVKGGVTAIPEYKHWNWWLLDDPWSFAWPQWKYVNNTWFIGTDPWDVFLTNHKYVKGEWRPNSDPEQGNSWYDCIDGPWLQSATKDARVCIYFDAIRAMNSPLADVTPRFINGTWMVLGYTWPEFATLMNRTLMLLPEGTVPRDLNVFEVQFTLNKAGEVLVAGQPWKKVFEEVVSTVLKFDKTSFGETLSCSYTGSATVDFADPNENCPTDCNGDCFGTAKMDDCGICTKGKTAFSFNELQDCMGVCRGEAWIDKECGVCVGGTSNYTSFLDIRDCSDTCVNKGGNKVFDCWGDCGGTAIINKCDECVGGNTGRAENFGIDQCGVCTSSEFYSESWDCNGDCNGNATWDMCADRCVGGNTGYAEDEFDSLFDCAGVCNGSFVVDSCGYCTVVDPTHAPYGSIYMDCAKTCHSPRDWDWTNWALNTSYTCHRCAGGATGKPHEYYRDGCGVCFGDNSTCADCEGVPYGDKQYDACNVCGGDGSSCVAVKMVEPRSVQMDSQQVFVLEGAGFNFQTQCIFTPSKGGAAVEVTPFFTNQTHLRCSAELPADTYVVSALVGQSPVSASDLTLVTVVAFNPSVVAVSSINPSQVILPKGGLTKGSVINITLTGQQLPTAGCVITGRYLRRVFAPATADSTNTRLTCTVKVSVVGFTSMELTVYPTYDKRSGLGSGSALFLVRERPNLVSITFSNTGSFLRAKFDSKVDLWDVWYCSEIFDNSIILGEGAECIQQTMKKVVIYLGREPTVAVGNSLTLKQNQVYVLFEDISQPASGSMTVSSPPSAVAPKAVIAGPPFISYCDNLYLSGRRSSGGGGRQLNYYWSVSSLVGGNVAVIQDALNTQNGSSIMYVNGSLLDQGATYTIRLSVSNFLAPSSLVSVSHDIVREDVVKPRVQIDARANTDKLQASDNFGMMASVELSSCATVAQLNYQWSSSTPGVKINVNTRTRRFYFVRKNDLPAGKTIDFHVDVTIPSQPGIKSRSTIKLTTLSTPLVPLVAGGFVRTVGRGSGEVDFDGSVSIDPDNEAIPMTYLWSCKRFSNGGSCLSVKTGENFTAFPTKAEKTQSVLKFDALRFQENELYQMTLTVTKEKRSATTSVFVAVIAGQPPKVSLGSSAATGTVNVKPGQVVTLQIDITSVAEILPSGIVWQSQQLDGYGYVNLTDSSKLEPPGVIFQRRGLSNVYISIIRISAASLSKGSTYKIDATVTSVEGKSSKVTADVVVRGGVTSCVFQASNYTELEQVTLETKNCFAPEDSLPISYKYGYVDNGVYKSQTSKGLDSAVTVFGRKPPTGNTMTFYVEVCDKFAVCVTLVSSPVTVLPKLSISAAEVEVAKKEQVDKPASIGDFTTAMVNWNAIDLAVDSVGGSRRRRSVHSRHRRDVAPVNSTETSTTLLTLTANFIKSSTMTREDVFLILEQLENLKIVETNAADQVNLLNYLDTLVTYLTQKNGMDKAHAQIVLDKLSELLTYPANSKFVIYGLESKVMKAMTFDLSFGGTMMEVKAKSNPRVTVTSAYNTLASIFSSTSSVNASVVDFGSELANTYLNWACGGSSNCVGAVGKFRHYDTDIDDKSSSTSDKNNRASDLVEVTLANPSTGDDLVVQNLTVPIKINMTLTKAKVNSVYTCHYWDDAGAAWSTKGVSTAGTVGNQVMCESTHLSIFVVMASDAPTTAAANTTVATMTTSSDSSLSAGSTTVTVGHMTNQHASTTQKASAPVNSVPLIVGIAVGGFVVLVILIVIIALVVKKLKTNKIGSASSSTHSSGPQPRLIGNAFERAATPTDKQLYGSRKQGTGTPDNV